MSLKKLALLSLCFLITTIFSIAQTPMQVAGTATKTATTSGNWSSTATWGGSLPVNDDRILIPNGVTITVDGMIAQEFKSIRIDNGGKLQFATNVNTELRTEYLFSGMMGTLEIGTNSNKVATDVNASLVFAERGGTTSSFDPQRFAPGAVLMGTTTMHGTDKTSWLTLQTQPSAGATQLVLKSAPIGWQVGDNIVVAGTDPITNAAISNTNEIGSDEVVTITNVSGNTVTFTPALVKDHKAPAQATDLDVHVANLSRNIVISSENTSVTSISGDFNKPRGHIMFMHTLNVDLKYVAANNLGRTDKSIILDDWDFEDLDAKQNTGGPVPNGGKNPRGRYSFHFHRGGLDVSVFPAKPIIPLPTPARVEGCVVNNDPGWGFVNHSARVDFVKNVSYDVVGGAFNTEAGNETGSFVENIAIRTINPQNPIMAAPRPRNSYTSGGPTQALSDIREGRQDFAWQGDGFWFHGTGVTVSGNVVSGCTGHAYVYWTDGLIEKGLGMARGDIDAHVPAAEFPTQNQLLKDWKETYPNFSLDIWYLQPRPFTGNTAYNFARGVQTYYVHTEFHRKTNPNITDPNEWINDLPDAYKDQLNLVFDNTTLWNIGRVGFEHNYTTNVTIQNSRIVGYGARTGFENYGTNPAPNYVSNESEVTGLDLDYFHNTHRWVLKNNTIEGFAGNSVGVALPQNALVTVDGGTFNNSGTDILIGAPSSTIEQGNEGFGVGMLSVNPTKSEILLQGNLTFQNSNNNFVMDAQIIFDEVGQKGYPLLDDAKADSEFFLNPQEITLNFGPFSNARVYYNEQDANFIPLVSGSSGNACSFSDPTDCVDSEFVNKTNAELYADNEVSYLGVITPATAVTHPMIIGGKVNGVIVNPCQIPTAIPSVTVNNNDCATITLNWTVVDCATSYEVQRSIDNGAWITINATVSGITFTDNVPGIGDIKYQVRAKNSFGNGAYTSSNIITCTNAPLQYSVQVGKEGTGDGTVNTNPSGNLFNAGASVTITATPNADSEFAGWNGDITSTDNPLTIIVNNNVSLTAIYNLKDTGGGAVNTIDVVNFSFELPGEGEELYEFSEIPGWSKGGDGESGLEKAWNPTDGEWICIHTGGDNYIKQTLTYEIAARKTYTLEVDAKDLEGDEFDKAKAQVLLKYGSTTIVDLKENLSTEWKTISISFNADDYPAAIGEPLKIQFRNNGAEDSWTGFDNFKLTTTNTNSMTTSLARVSRQKPISIKVFPNPIIANQHLNVQITGFEKEVNIRLFDANGRLMKTIKERNNTHLIESTIPLQNLPAGLYFISVADGLRKEMTRFVVQ